MTIVLAFASALCFGVALVLTQLGLRHLSPLAGAAIAIPSSTLLLICVAPVALAGSAVQWNAVLIFAAVARCIRAPRRCSPSRPIARSVR